jgi:hypothetical protein
MSEHLVTFESAGRCTAVALPFDLEEVLAGWGSLRVAMTRTLPPGFERDEWAYLIQFLEAGALRDAFTSSFGAASDASAARPDLLARPRGTVALWLPNNVSLLGPLTTILLSLTGNRLLLKGGSRSEDLTGAFLAFALGELEPGALRTHLEENVAYEVFDRDDPRNAAYAAEAAVRIVFGGDEAAAAIEALPHPLDSRAFAFVDRRSEAWVSPGRADDELVDTLIKVFAIYGQAGCTSPRRVVLIDGEPGDALALRDRMLARWPDVIRARPAPHVASGCVMARQWAAALGWDAALATSNGAVLAAGEPDLESFEGPMGLALVAASLDRAVADLPANIQTIGHALDDAGSPRWLELLARLAAKRFVPLARMHHFGPVWDGSDYWRQTFEEVEVGT